MPLDRERLKSLLADIDKLLAELPIGDTLRAQVKDKVFGPALAELHNLVDNARPPVFYIVGRSGHGKSSLVNALAGREVAPVGDIEPTTAAATEHTISFDDVGTRWTVVDSRGIFETTTPAGAVGSDALDQVCEDMKRFKPDVICHVVNAQELRAFAQDLRAMSEVRKVIEKQVGAMPPCVMVLNKIDLLGNPREWPPEEVSNKRDQIERLLKYGAADVLHAAATPIAPSRKHEGSNLLDSHYVAMVPLRVLSGEPTWNLRTLTDLIAERLPTSAQLHFFQAYRDEHLLRRVSQRLTKEFAAGAATVAALPIPFEDIVLITPLQLCMIAVIGALAGKPLAKSTAFEFLSAAGIAVSAGMTLRLAASTVMKFVPLLGSIVGGGVAYGGTIALGNAAEKYFFDKDQATFPGAAVADSNAKETTTVAHESREAKASASGGRAGATTRCEACDEAVLVKWMNYCPNCGDEVAWDEAVKSRCEECDAPTHEDFNYCFACGASFERRSHASSDVAGFDLQSPCANSRCSGTVGNLMSFCPWCGEEQDWKFPVPMTLELREVEAGGFRVGYCRRKILLLKSGCGSRVDPFWFYCAFCGNEIPRAGGGIMPGTKVTGTHTCMQCSSQWQSRVMLEASQELPFCNNCGIHSRWIRGK